MAAVQPSLAPPRTNYTQEVRIHIVAVELAKLTQIADNLNDFVQMFVPFRVVAANHAARVKIVSLGKGNPREVIERVLLEYQFRNGNEATINAVIDILNANDKRAAAGKSREGRIMVKMTNLFAIPDMLKNKWEGAKLVENPTITEVQEKLREAEFQSAAG